MLTLEDITRKLGNCHETLVAEFNVKTLEVFGSTARGQATENSDVDILVDFNGPGDFLTFMNLKTLLEEVLGAQVDLVTRKALRPMLRSQVEREAVRVT